MKDKGFTLIELMVLVSIISILVSTVLPSITDVEQAQGQTTSEAPASATSLFTNCTSMCEE